MITKSKAFLTSDGQVFLTQAEAQQSELSTLLTKIYPDEKMDVGSLSEQLIASKDEVLAILSLRKPREKKVRGKAAKLTKTIQHSETGS